MSRMYPGAYVVGIANELNDLKIRFSAVEKFATQMGEYVRNRNDQDNEDRQYRTA